MPLGVKVAEPLALVLCLLLFTGGSVHAQPDEEQTITYGDLYLADDLDTLGNRHRVGVGAGYETGNRLLNVFHLQLKYTYQLTELFGLGVLGRTFSFAPTALNRRVE